MVIEIKYSISAEYRIKRERRGGRSGGLEQCLCEITLNDHRHKNVKPVSMDRAQ